MSTKQCSKCKIEKDILEFFKDKKKKDGLCLQCKNCFKNDKKRLIYRKKYNSNPIVKERNKKWKKNHPEKVKESDKKFRKNNLEKVRGWKKNYYKNNLKKIREYQEGWVKNNPQKRRIYNQRWYKKNIEKVKEIHKKWKKNNKRYYKKYTSNKRKTDIHYKIKCNISALIRERLKRRLFSKNGQSTFTFLPYTVDDLIKHLESLFQPWINWQNYGNKAGYWTIDHIKPDSSFHYTSVENEEFQKCWALSNLQPMEFIENIKKSDKLIYGESTDQLQQHTGLL